MHTFKIHAPFDANEAFIEMDGKRLEGVTRINFEIAAQRTVELTLTVMGYVDITGEFKDSEILVIKRPEAVGDPSTNPASTA